MPTSNVEIPQFFFTAQELFCVLRGKIVIINTLYWGSHKLS